MNLRTLLVWLVGAGLIAGAYRAFGWSGVALVTGGIIFWMLIHFNRVMTALRRAANRPIGYIDSAVMLNARLKPGDNLLHVVAITRSLGQALSEKDAQPEIFRWTDPGGSYVTCEFRTGKLVKHEMVRPPEPAGGDSPSAP